MQIRKAVKEDALSIKKIHIETYQKSYRGYLPDDFLDSLCIDDDVIERTKKYIQKTECYVAEEKGQVVGFAYVTYPENTLFEINALYIHPSYQRQGIGRSLIADICLEKVSKGFKKCEVWTIKSGPSLGFYKKMGFEITSDEKIWRFGIPIIKLEKKVNQSENS